MSGATSSQAFDLSAPLGGGKDDDEELPHRPDFFHLLFALAACYMAVLFVGWDLSGADSTQYQIDRGWGSTWVKIAAAWLCGERWRCCGAPPAGLGALAGRGQSRDPTAA